MSQLHIFYYLCMVVLLLDISLRPMLIKLLVAVLIFLIYNVPLSLLLILSSNLISPVLTLAAVIVEIFPMSWNTSSSEDCQLGGTIKIFHQLTDIQQLWWWEWEGGGGQRGRNLITRFRGGLGVTF